MDAQQPKQNQVEVPQEKSWGDRFKHGMFDKFTYVFLNFFVNATASASLAYVIERKIGKEASQSSTQLGKKIGGLIGADAERMAEGIFKAIRSFFLSIAGHLLAPAIKSLEDHRKRVEFSTGHWLDKLQTFLGQGNAASQQNIIDYDKVKLYQQGGDIAFSDTERERLWEKHRIEMSDVSKDIIFRENRLGLLKVFVARTIGWIAAEVTNFVFGITNKNSKKLLRYETYEKMTSPHLQTALGYVPGFNKLADPKKFSDLLVNDTVLTVSSAVTHKLVQNALHHEPKALRERKQIVVKEKESFTARQDAEKANNAIAPQMSYSA